MIEEQVRQDFERARYKALFHELLSIVRREPNDLIPYHEVRRRVSPDRESYRGYQVVPVRQIVGSVDRFHDFDRRVPLYASMSPFELLQQVEYAEFLRLTDLDRLRSDHDIRPTALGRYDEMWDHILLHQEGMSERRGEQVPIADAVKSWYDEIYLPIARVVRDRHLLDRFPERSEADVYLWVMANREALEEREGQELDPESTASAFADVIERESTLAAKIGRMPRVVRRGIRKMARPRPAGP